MKNTIFTVTLLDEYSHDDKWIDTNLVFGDEDQFAIDWEDCKKETLAKEPEEWNVEDIFALMKARGYQFIDVSSVSVSY